MTKKVYYTWEDVEHMIGVLNNLMYTDDWRPDYIVGLTRGGLVPASMLSNATDILMHTLDTRDESHESNLWMAEDAFGYVTKLEPESSDCYADHAKNILIIDDINHSGKGFEWLKQDWQASCMSSSERWDKVWGENVRFATLVDNAASDFKDVDYTAVELNKSEEDVWCIFPWEGERNYGNQS